MPANQKGSRGASRQVDRGLRAGRTSAPGQDAASQARLASKIIARERGAGNKQSTSQGRGDESFLPGPSPQLPKSKPAAPPISPFPGPEQQHTQYDRHREDYDTFDAAEHSTQELLAMLGETTFDQRPPGSMPGNRSAASHAEDKIAAHHRTSQPEYTQHHSAAHAQAASHAHVPQQQPELAAATQQTGQPHNKPSPPPWLISDSDHQQQQPLARTKTDKPAYHHQSDSMSGVLSQNAEPAASMPRGKQRQNMNGLIAGLSEQQAVQAQAARQQLLDDLEKQVREKKAQKEAQKRREREADEREERRAREGHAQLVAQAMAQAQPPKTGPFENDAWQGVASEGSQEVVLGAAGLLNLPPPSRTVSNIGRMADLSASMGRQQKGRSANARQQAEDWQGRHGDLATDNRASPARVRNGASFSDDVSYGDVHRGEVTRGESRRQSPLRGGNRGFADLPEDGFASVQSHEHVDRAENDVLHHQHQPQASGDAATQQLLRQLQEDQATLLRKIEQQSHQLDALQSSPMRERQGGAPSQHPMHFSPQQMASVAALKPQSWHHQQLLSLRADSNLLPASLTQIPDDPQAYDLRNLPATTTTFGSRMKSEPTSEHPQHTSQRAGGAIKSRLALPSSMGHSSNQGRAAGARQQKQARQNGKGLLEGPARPVASRWR